jgi:hypothetical protein
MTCNLLLEAGRWIYFDFCQYLMYGWRSQPIIMTAPSFASWTLISLVQISFNARTNVRIVLYCIVSVETLWRSCSLQGVFRRITWNRDLNRYHENRRIKQTKNEAVSWKYQDNRVLGRDLDPGPLDYETGMLTTRPRRSIWKCKMLFIHLVLCYKIVSHLSIILLFPTFIRLTDSTKRSVNSEIKY